jgi:hypothetical protein
VFLVFRDALVSIVAALLFFFLFFFFFVCYFLGIDGPPDAASLGFPQLSNGRSGRSALVLGRKIDIHLGSERADTPASSCHHLRERIA